MDYNSLISITELTDFCVLTWLSGHRTGVRGVSYLVFLYW